jgi:hypothetical protein
MLGKTLGHELYKLGPHSTPPWIGPYLGMGPYSSKIALWF